MYQFLSNSLQIISNFVYFLSTREMDDADEFSSTGVLFEDCEMSSTNIQMRDLVLKFLVNLRSDEATEMTQMNELEAICQITRDVLSDGNQSEEGFKFILSQNF